LKGGVHLIVLTGAQWARFRSYNIGARL